MKMLAVLLLCCFALAGCASASQTAYPADQGTAQAAANTSLTPAQTACVSAIDAFNAIAKPLTQHDPAATAMTAQQWSTGLVASANTPGLPSAVATAIAREAGGIADAGIMAEEVQSDPADYPWGTVMTPAERQIDTDFTGVEQVCQAVGVHT